MTTPSHGSPQHYGSFQPAVSSEDRSMALVAHLSTIVAMVISAGWLSFVGPLVVWFLYRDKSAFVRECAAGAFNFNLSMWVLSIIGWVCIFTVILIPVGVVLLAVSWIAQIVFHIIGAVRANRGEVYRYPMQFLRVLS